MKEKTIKNLDSVYLDLMTAIAAALPRYIAAEWTEQDIYGLLKYHPEQIVADWLIGEIRKAEKEDK